MTKPLILQAEKEDLGGFSVHRALPGPNWRYVGPFVFFDHMGPMNITQTQAVDVRPHPHIGLATVTYLFEGRITHRDSIGSLQNIEPGDLNWMTAGKAIVHSEHTPQEDRNPGNHNVAHGIQIWVGLPKKDEQCEPSFVHWEKEKLPNLNLAPNLTAKVMLGTYSGATSPVKTLCRTLFMDFNCSGDTEFKMPILEKEMGFYLVEGSAMIDGNPLQKYEMAILDDAKEVSLSLAKGTRMIVIGGEPFAEKRYMWWNFVSSDQELIAQAKIDWVNQTMGKVKGEEEYAPLPTNDDA